MTDAMCFKRTLVMLGVALMLPFTAFGAGLSLSEAQARYQKDRAACLAGDTNQDRQTCLQEVGAMLQEVKRGRVLVLNEQQYIHNQSVRCAALPPDDREDCQRRMGGQGTTQGSAESGGIYRELTRSLPPEKP